MTPLIALAGGYVVTRCMDQGISDMSGMVTLRHGTDLASWFKIHAFGAQPAYDRSNLFFKNPDESSPFVVANMCERYGVDFTPLLQALKDKIDELPSHPLLECVKKVYNFVLENRLVSFLINQLKKASPLLNFAYSNTPLTVVAKRVVMHSVPVCQRVIASTRSVNHYLPSTTLLNALPKAAAIALSALTPTIKIRLHPDQIKKTFRESSIPGAFVLLTDETISPLNMGLIGTIKNSMRPACPSILRSPSQVLKGTAVVLASGAVAYGAVTLFPSFVVAHQTALVAGAILAVV